MKYQPTDDEPRLVAYRRGVWIEGDAEYETLEEVEAEVQRVALAIADRVHGAELAALRAEVESLKAEVERFEAEPAPAPAPAWKVGDRVTVLVDTPVPGISIIIPQGAIGTVTEVFDDRRIEVDWGREYGPRWWMDVSTLSPAPERDWDAELREASPVNDRAPTYDEVIAAARAANREIEAEWPQWKKELSPMTKKNEKTENQHPRYSIREVQNFGWCITRDGTDVVAVDELDALANELVAIVRSERKT